MSLHLPLIFVDCGGYEPLEASHLWLNGVAPLTTHCVCTINIKKKPNRGIRTPKTLRMVTLLSVLSTSNFPNLVFIIQ